MENLLDHLFSSFIPPNLEVIGWAAIYFIGITAVSALNYYTANEEELDNLNEDIDDL